MLSQSSLPSHLIEPAASNITAINTHKPEANADADGAAIQLHSINMPSHVGLVCMTPLDRKGGSAEFLQGLAHWAASRSETTVELLWAGDGIMRLVLAAQPNPPNLVQRFAGHLDLQAIAALLRGRQALVVPRVSELSQAVATYALLSGLHVLCGETKRHRWGVLQGQANLHSYSRHHCETLLPALSAAFAAMPMAATEPTAFQAASYAA